MNERSGFTFKRLIAYSSSILAGLLVGILFHYLLYRMSLPGQPFIYVVF